MAKSDMHEMEFRYYVFASDGIWKIPKRKLGWEALPQFAGTKQKILNVLYWREGGAIKTDFGPDLMAFDAEGRWDRAYSVEGSMAALELADLKARAKRAKVLDLGKVLDAKKRLEAHRWKPTQAEIDQVMLDLLAGDDPHRRSIPYAKLQRGERKPRRSSKRSAQP
jgi:hypothetical protein